MSEFDDNPFADPFAEPSIRQATQPTANNATLDNYDPFSNVTNNTAPAPSMQSGGSTLINAEPAVMAPTATVAAAPPPYTQSGQQQVTSADFQRRQEELEKKAQELARKEEELKHAAAAGGARQNNWPPLPAVFPVGPCFYQDINVDIPLEFQKIVRMLYYLWMFHALMLLLNILGGLAIFIALGDGATFGLALLYFFIFTPFSYLCWFRPIYKAFRSDSSFNFMVFFFVFFFQVLVCVADAVGIPNTGACGWVSVGYAFKNDAPVLGVFLVLVALASSALALGMAFALMWVHRIYRSTGASFAKAQAEFAQGVMTNEHVRGAATDAMSVAARNYADNATGGGRPNN